MKTTYSCCLFHTCELLHIAVGFCMGASDIVLQPKEITQLILGSVNSNPMDTRKERCEDRDGGNTVDVDSGLGVKVRQETVVEGGATKRRWILVQASRLGRRNRTSRVCRVSSGRPKSCSLPKQGIKKEASVCVLRLTQKLRSQMWELSPNQEEYFNQMPKWVPE